MPSGPSSDLAHLVVAVHADDDDVAHCAERRERLDADRAEAPCLVAHLRATREHVQLVPRGPQAPPHGHAHLARADEADGE